jgi:hypothetical protein
MRAAVIPLLMLIAGPAWAVDCTYRPSTQFVTQFDGKTFASVLTAGTDYKKTMANTWVYYAPSAPMEPEPTIYEPGRHAFTRTIVLGPNGEQRRLTTRWYQQLHEQRADEAVIFIHGSSSVPDMAFADSQAAQAWPMDYLNHGGTTLYNAGYDVFAPHVTHVARFLIAGTRLAEANGDSAATIEINRVLATYNHAKSLGYTRIHMIGLSSGAQYTGHAARVLRDDPQRGVFLAVEGWLPETQYARVGDSAALYLWNWENMFGNGQSDAVFRDLPARTYVAYGSCSITADAQWPGLSDLYSAPYATLPSEKVIFYTGAHEYLHSVFAEAMARAYP